MSFVSIHSAMHPLAAIVKSHTAVYVLIAASSLAMASYQPADAIAEGVAKAAGRIVLDSRMLPAEAGPEMRATPVTYRSTQR